MMQDNNVHMSGAQRGAEGGRLQLRCYDDCGGSHDETELSGREMN